jgi:uncharacterized iron-regulated membrane protein
MRKYHRWLAIIFGAFLLVIAASGLTIQYLELTGDKGPPGGRPPGSAQVAGAPVAGPGGQLVCPPPAPRPKPKGPMVFVKHLHSGELFGPVGTLISILSGLALFFFAFSGLWMYVQMFRNRKGAAAGKWFW